MKNMAMMQHACAALERTGCAHLAYFSSDAVYGTGPATVNEDTPAAPQDRIAEPHLDDFRDPPVLPLRDLDQMVIRKNRYSFLNFR